MLSVYQYKTHKLSHILHTDPLKKGKETRDQLYRWYKTLLLSAGLLCELLYTRLWYWLPRAGTATDVCAICFHLKRHPIKAAAVYRSLEFCHALS